MGIIEQNNIRLVNKVIFGENHKSIIFPDDISLANDDWTAISHIACFNDIPLLQEIIDNVNLAIAGNHSQIDDNGVCDGTGLYNGYIEPGGIKYYNKDLTTFDPNLYPLNKFKELLIDWKTFLETKPYDAYTDWG